MRRLRETFTKKRLFSFLFVHFLFLIILTNIIQGQEKSKDERVLVLIKEAQELYEKAEYTLAIEKFKQAIEEIKKLKKEQIYEEKIVEAYLTIGICYIGKGDFESAKKNFSEVLKRKPDLELDPVWYSPKVINIFNEAKLEYMKNIQEKEVKKPEELVKEKLQEKNNIGYGWLIISAYPFAEIFIDNENIGFVPPQKKVKLPLGKHIIKLIFKSNSHEEEILIEENKVKKYHYNFEDKNNNFHQ